MIPQDLPIALRAFVDATTAPAPRQRHHTMQAIGPSDRVLVIDTETTTDASQQLRFGVYQLREGDPLAEAGIFYDAESLTDDELAILSAEAERLEMRLMPVAEFIEDVFYEATYEGLGTLVGFNLPFDISRLAIAHAPARGKAMRGGFSFRLSANRRWPRIQIKHLSQRAALIRFAMVAGTRAGRGMRRRRQRRAPRRGYFVDVKTAAAALTARSFSLAGLADHLAVPNRKLNTNEHGGPLTADYVAYAARDVQTTWECYVELRDRFARFGLTRTPLPRIYSEASLGKAHLREMGVDPWREVQPDLDPRMTGIILSTYYGGRTEVRIRRQVRQVAYCDFLSMYPTVCVLMNLWRFITASGIRHRDATEETRNFLETLTPEIMQRPATWLFLHVLVQVMPDDDLFPVRAKYGGETHYTIGLNHLTASTPMWFTLADCVTATLLGGKPPKVLQAVRFEPKDRQPSLHPVSILGDDAYRIDPVRDDFIRRLIELRSDIRAQEVDPDSDAAARRDTAQQAVKILANATSYGIFIELNPNEMPEPVQTKGYGNGEAFDCTLGQVEEPGRYFHPLLGTLITGAARLMLALTEQLIRDSGLDWVFCDTDSMAIARPPDMAEPDFHAKVQAIRDWFASLNPYRGRAGGASILKLEDTNFAVAADGSASQDLAPLYCFAVSPKRYAMFNLAADDRPILRKASAHGLGHLTDPYGDAAPPVSIAAPLTGRASPEVSRWQHDVWVRIILAALVGRPEQVRVHDLPNFDQPAVSRYAATTPALLTWFKRYNMGKPYRQQVRPFNFLLAFQAKRPELDAQAAAQDSMAAKTVRPRATKNLPRAVAPYNRSLVRAAVHCFDRETGERIARRQLKTVSQALVRYHLRPDRKVFGAEYRDAGNTHPLHVRAAAIHFIGKEANRWEEQLHLGEDPEAQAEYGTLPSDRDAMAAMVQAGIRRHGAKAVAARAGISRQHASSVITGARCPSPAVLELLTRAVAALNAEQDRAAAEAADRLQAVRRACDRHGIRHVARIARINDANLSRIIAGKRRASPVTTAALMAAIRRLDAVDTEPS